MNCAICKHNDGNIYTSIPVKYRCKITGEYHESWYNCDVEFAPVRHGRWEQVGDNTYRCSVCGEISCCNSPFCSECGAKMVNEDD